MELSRLNRLGASEARDEFLKCCGSQVWADRMVESRPFESFDSVVSKAGEIWWSLHQDDWLEAFRSHPKIGGRKAAAKVADQSRAWSGQEQSGVKSASEQILSELASLNHEYEARFGFIFIVCATGKSSDEMLEILKSRLANDAQSEIRIAAHEQQKITEIRLRKLLFGSVVKGQ